MDDQWIEHLTAEYSPTLMKYLMHHISSREDAEDILQEVFLSCRRHASEFDPKRCNEQAWLYIIAKRKLVSYYRAKKDQVSLDAMESDLIPGKDDMSQAVNVMIYRQTLAKALAKLDARSREVIVLRYFKGMSSKEVAQRLDISPVNVRVIQNRALGKLNKILEDAGFTREDIFS